MTKKSEPDNGKPADLDDQSEAKSGVSTPQTAEAGVDTPPTFADRAKGIGRRLGKNGVIIVVVILAFVVGYIANRGSGPAKGDGHASHAGKGSGKKKLYTCSMHPQIQLPNKKARCPICGMALIPVSAGGASQSSNPRELTMTARAQKLAEIEVTPVVRQKAAAKVRVVGKVAYDERRVGYITSWVGGRIDKLFVKFTGVKVRRWQPMVYIYSPELVTTQMELIQIMTMLIVPVLYSAIQEFHFKYKLGQFRPPEGAPEPTDQPATVDSST